MIVTILFMHMLLTWDQAVFYTINHTRHLVLDVFFLWIGEFQLTTLCALILLSTFLSKRQDRARISILCILLLFIVDLLCDYLFKPAFYRPRPCQVLDQVALLIPCPHSSSFPSGHATTIFAIAVFLGSYYPQWTGILAASTLAVCLSRMYLGVHYPLDVLGGAILGTLCALLFRSLINRVCQWIGKKI